MLPQSLLKSREYEETHKQSPTGTLGSNGPCNLKISTKGIFTFPSVHRPPVRLSLESKPHQMETDLFCVCVCVEYFTYSAPCISLSPWISFLEANIRFQHTHTHTLALNGPKGSHVSTVCWEEPIVPQWFYEKCMIGYDTKHNS